MRDIQTKRDERKDRKKENDRSQAERKRKKKG